MIKKLMGVVFTLLYEAGKTLLCILAVLFCAAFLNRAFASVKDVGFDDFYLSDDGQTMTICVSAGDQTSYRYIRSMSVKKDSNSIYLTFRPTFFGKLGAKDTFQISLQGGQKRIVVGSPTDSTGVGLSWDTDSGWQPYHFSVQNTQ